jgi:hypothetical protein
MERNEAHHFKEAASQQTAKINATEPSKVRALSRCHANNAYLIGAGISPLKAYDLHATMRVYFSLRRIAQPCGDDFILIDAEYSCHPFEYHHFVGKNSFKDLAHQHRSYALQRDADVDPSYSSSLRYGKYGPCTPTRFSRHSLRSGCALWPSGSPLTVRLQGLLMGGGRNQC